MSLLSTDISKVKRLSLSEVKLPTPEAEIKPTNIDLKETGKAQVIINLAFEILETENCYKEEEVINRIIEATKVNIERAKSGFNLMLKEKAIEGIIGGWYVLKGSTPF